MTSQSLISVLMPARELTPYTQAAVSSVLNQSHQHLELLIIGNDNADQLRSGLIVDSRVTVINRQSPGIVGALNTGLDACDGDFIARMDSDDLCHPDRLASQLAMAEQNPDTRLIGACVELFCDEAALGQGNQHYQQWLNSLTTSDAINHACFIESPIPHPTMFAHRDFWQSIGPYRDQGWPEDYDLVLRTWLAGIPMAKPDKTLLQWREHPARLTHTDPRYSREAFIKAKAWALMQPASGLQLDEGRSVWICGTGRNARYWHDALIDQGARVNGFVELDNAKPRTQKRHLPVITYKELIALKKDALVVSAISGWSARMALSDWFSNHHLLSGVDYILGG